MKKLITPIIILAALVVLTLGLTAASSSAGSVTGLRVVHVTDQNDRTGARNLVVFALRPGDKMFVSRHLVRVTHPDGSTLQIGLLHFFSMTVSRVQK